MDKAIVFGTIDGGSIPSKGTRNVKKSAVAFIIHNHKALLILRDNIPSITEPNKWALPGGRADGDETFDEAIKRELHEEINLVPEKLALLRTFDVLDHDFSERKVALYWAKISDIEFSKVVLGDEGQKLEYFSYEELWKVDLTKNLTKYLQVYGEQVKKLLT